MAKTTKSPVTTIVIVALALLIFVAAVAIGARVLGGKQDVDASASVGTSDESQEEPQESEPEEEAPDAVSSEPESTPETLPEVTKTSAVTSKAPAATPAPSAAPAATPAPSAAPAAGTLTGVFDAAVMNGSNKGAIAASKQINSDVKGWLKVPGTNINYPVLHDTRILPAPTYHYYIDRDIYKNLSKNGVIYADPYAALGTSAQLSKNVVLYGHNWTNYSANPRIGNVNDVMFAQLTAYHHLNFAKQYPYIYFSTEQEEMAWVVFAAFYTDVSFYYNNPNPSDEDFQAIVNGAKARSRHNFDVPVYTTDKIITLSTCTRAYGQSANQRFVVMAKRVNIADGFKAVTVATNPNPVLPKL